MNAFVVNWTDIHNAAQEGDIKSMEEAISRMDDLGEWTRCESNNDAIVSKMKKDVDQLKKLVESIKTGYSRIVEFSRECRFESGAERNRFHMKSGVPHDDDFSEEAKSMHAKLKNLTK